MAVRIKAHRNKLEVPLGTTSDLTIRGAIPDDNLTGVNWYGNDEVGFVSNQNSTLTLQNNGAWDGHTPIGATNDMSYIKLDRTTAPNSTKYTSIDFTNSTGTNKMLSLRSFVESSGNFGFKLHTAATNAYNTLPALSALSTNKVGFNIATPQVSLHLSENGTAIAAPFVDTGTNFTISAEADNSPGITISSFNVNNTTRAVLKGVKAKGDTATPTAVTDTNYTLSILGAGYDGTSSLATAAIDFQVSGTVSTGTMPQALILKTGTTNTAIERMRITPVGKVGIGTNSPGSTLSVVGGVGVGSSYALSTIASGTIVAQQNIGVGLTGPTGNFHSFSSNANVSHFYAETNTTGTGGAWFSFKDGLVTVPHRLGVKQGVYTFTLGGSLWTDIADMKIDGFRYKADYSATWTDRSLVDKAYVDNAVAGGGGGGGGATNLSFSGSSSPITLASDTGTDVTFTAGSGISLAQSANNMTITCTVSSPTVIGVTDQVNGLDISLSGGNILIAPNIPELTLSNTYDSSDTIMFYDATASAHRKMAIGTYLGGGFVDLTTNQTIAGDKGFTTSLHYGSSALPTSSNFGTSTQTNAFFKGGSTAIVESNFNNSQGLILHNYIDNGTQAQTVKIIAAGSDASNSGSEVLIQTRPGGVGQNWVTSAKFVGGGGGAILAGNGNTGNAGGQVQVYASGGGSVGFEGGYSNYQIGSTGSVSTTFFVSEGGSVRAHLNAGVDGWISGSDLRIKKDIKPLTVLPNIKHVKAVSYKRIDGADRDVIGVIAQDIQEAYPEAVFVREDTEEKLLGVSYNAIASIALQGVKELKQYIDILEKRITHLEQQLDKINNN